MKSGNYMATQNGKREEHLNSSTRQRYDQKSVSDKKQGQVTHNEDQEESNTQTGNYGECDLPPPSPPYDGKRAWIVLLGLVILTALNGLYISWGVMQDYYLRDKTFQEKNLVMRLTFVGVFFEVFFRFCIFFGNLLYSVIGFRLTIVLGITLMTGGLLLSSIINMIWQLYFSFGLCCGTGAALLTLVGYRILPQFFKKKLSTANGIFASSLAIGKIILPPIINQVNTSLGSVWTYRILAVIIFSCMVIGSSLITERKSMSKGQEGVTKKQQRVNEIFGFSLLKNLNLVLWLILCPIYLCVICITVILLPSTATAIGLSSAQGALIVTIGGFVGIVGAITIGVIADKFGNLNIFIICTTIGSLTIFLIWIFTHSFAGILLFSIICSLTSPSYYVVSTSVLIKIVGIKRYPEALGLRALATIFSILGPYLATYLETLQSDKEPYFYCKVVAGIGYSICTLIALIIKFRMDSKPFAIV